MREKKEEEEGGGEEKKKKKKKKKMMMMMSKHMNMNTNISAHSHLLFVSDSTIHISSLSR
jgi:hypothetical protein